MLTSFNEKMIWKLAEDTIKAFKSMYLDMNLNERK